MKQVNIKSLKLPKLFGGKASLDARKARSGYVFALPFILGVILVYLPILIDSVWASFIEPVTVNANNIEELIKLGYGDLEIGQNITKFVGIQHYREVLAGATSTIYLPVLGSAVQQLIFEVPAILIFSLFIAVVLNQKMLGRAAFRAIFFVPVIIATGLMESIDAGDKMTSEMEGGVDMGAGQSNANEIISAMDIEALFRSMKIGGELVTYVVTLVNDIYNIINYSGVQMLIFLAGLQSISPSIYEACQIEGASAWETFWKVTFPMISPMILVNAIYTMIDALTRPSNVMMAHLSTLPDNGTTAAMSWVFFVVVILIIAAVAGISSMFIFYQRRD